LPDTGRFGDLLKGLVFDDEVMDWVSEALHQSHAAEKRFGEKVLFLIQKAESKRKAPIAGFRVFELNVEARNTDCYFFVQ